MVHEMRRRGIRVDQSAAEQARDLLLQKRDAALAELSEKLGARVSMDEIGRTNWKAQTFDAHGITYPRTEKGNPSFKAGKTGWMAQARTLAAAADRERQQVRQRGNKFLEDHILEHAVNGRIYAEIHPHRSDDGGTRSFRFSYSNPPLQQMPARDEELAPLIRGVFLPEEGEVWAKPDVSPAGISLHRALRRHARSAQGEGGRRALPHRSRHRLSPARCRLDRLERKAAKNTNFAKAFGAGVRKFAEMIGKPEGEARAIYDQYDRSFRSSCSLPTRCQSTAAKQGYLVLYDGARRHWDGWEAPEIAWTKGTGPCSREEAERRIRDPNHPWYRRWIRRADTHTAMNALIQGSAARHTKLWMRACWREGIVPLLQMHDALDCSVTTREQGELVARLGCEAVSSKCRCAST